MRFLTFSLFAALISVATHAQPFIRYTFWGDGVANAQLSKSALYFLGVGARLEASRPVANVRHHLIASLGYTRFLQKTSGATTADAVRGIIGYRYQSKMAFGAHAGAGVQYLRETFRLNFSERVVRGELRSVLPTATVGIGLRMNAHLNAELAYRPSLRLEPNGNVLVNHIALSAGYTF